jgi:hypothetical protein
VREPGLAADLPLQPKHIIASLPERPGKNQNCYLAGACDAECRELTVVEGHRKNSALYIALLAALARRYRRARRIHIILVNFRIHHSQAAQLAVRSYEGQIVLHFVSPYCPDDNRIETGLAACGSHAQSPAPDACGADERRVVFRATTRPQPA